VIGYNPVRKPNHGEGIISTKPRPKSTYDFLCLMYNMYNYDVFIFSIDIFHNLMAQYSLFKLKVPLNTIQPVN